MRTDDENSQVLIGVVFQPVRSPRIDSRDIPSFYLKPFSIQSHQSPTRDDIVVLFIPSMTMDTDRYTGRQDVIVYEVEMPPLRVLAAQDDDPVQRAYTAVTLGQGPAGHILSLSDQCGATHLAHSFQPRSQLRGHVFLIAEVAFTDPCVMAERHCPSTILCPVWADFRPASITAISFMPS